MPTCTNPATLGGSAFEIDGNMIVNTSGCIDWLTSGTNSFMTGVTLSSSANGVFTQGASENDANPAIKLGNGPPKDGLTRFGVFTEDENTTADPPNGGKFLDLFFSKIPSSGTTDVDFELNQLFCNKAATPSNCSSNGVTPTRSVGDKLIQFDFANGGTSATITISTWTGTAWNALPGTTISGGSSPQALGEVDNAAIPDGQDGGLGGGQGLAVNAFGEASIAFPAIFQGQGCGEFGSVYTKARTSTSPSAALKNFIVPQQVLISSCPTITSSATQHGTAGGSISDSATLGSVTSNAQGSLTFSAYTNTTCTAPAAFTSSAIPVNGPGTYGSGNFTNAPAGTYTWKVAYSGDSNGNQAFSICGAPDGSETSMVSGATPTISTTLSASSGSITVGGTASDSASATGGDNPTGNVSFAVYTDSSCTTLATTGASGQIDAQPSGSVPFGQSSAAVTFQKTGTYYWQASYGGDTNNTKASSTCGSEKLTVGAASPTISTSLSPSSGSITVGGTASDSASASGGFNPTGDVSFAVYSDSSCSTLATTGTGGQINAQPAGTVSLGASSASVTFQKAGTYYWQATYNADGNDKNNNSEKSTCGSEKLTVGAASPTITTSLSASSGSVTVGGTASDSASATGGFNPTGDVSFAVYTDSACTNLASTGSSGQINAQPSGTVALGASSASVTFQQTGTYYWQATYNADGKDPNNNSEKSTCGSEKLIVNAASPTITTSLSATSGSTTVGGSVSDIASATGGFNPTGDVSFAVYSDGSCSTLATTGTGGQINAEPSGTVALGASSASVTFQQPGTYYWQATYNADGLDKNNNSEKSTCGSEKLTVVGLPSSSLSKTAQDVTPPVGQPGTTISANPGDMILYTITYTNSGNGPATIASLSDPVPSFSSYDSCGGGPAGTTCSVSGTAPNQSVSWTLPSGTTVPGGGGTISVTFEVTLNQTFPSGTTSVTNQATVCTAAGEETPPCHMNPPTTVNVTAAPHLKITKSVPPGTQGIPGQNITYTLQYQNTGNADATNTTISEEIPGYPTDTQFVSCTGPGGAAGGCSGPSATGAVTWSVGTVKAGAAAGTVTFTVQVLNSVGCQIQNTAYISSPDQAAGGQIPSNALTVPSTPGPNPAGANASGSAYGASVNALLGLISLPAVPNAVSSQSGVGTNGQGKTALPINLLNTISLNLLSATSKAQITNSPAQADDISSGELTTVNILGGVITADVVEGQAEATANGSGSSISAAGTTITNLKIGGQSYANITPNETVQLPLGLGYVVLDEQIGSTSVPSGTSGGTYAADLTVNALDVHVASVLDVAQIIVGHAVAHADFPQTTVCTHTGLPTQSVSGHAFTASVNTTPSIAPILSGFVGIPASGGSASQSVATASVPSTGSIVQAVLVGTSSTGSITPTSSTSTSIATVGNTSNKKSVGLTVLGGLITAQAVTSEASSTATATGASSSAAGTQFLNLVVAGVPITATITPNFTIQLAGLGYVVLNEQIPEVGVAGHTGLTVNAIDVHVTLANTLGLNVGADVIVNSAHADATFIAPAP